LAIWLTNAIMSNLIDFLIHSMDNQKYQNDLSTVKFDLSNVKF